MFLNNLTLWFKFEKISISQERFLKRNCKMGVFSDLTRLPYYFLSTDNFFKGDEELSYTNIYTTATAIEMGYVNLYSTIFFAIRDLNDGNLSCR